MERASPQRAVLAYPASASSFEHVYEANHAEPDAVEREALDLDEADVQRRRPSFDKALGLLERRLGDQRLRETVISRLSKPATGELVVHRALIDLSRRPTGVRLITTNFDGRVVEAGVPESEVDAAPKLPVPASSAQRFHRSSMFMSEEVGVEPTGRVDAYRVSQRL